MVVSPRNFASLSISLNSDRLVPPGIYSVEVIASKHVFPAVRIEVSGSEQGKVRAMTAGVQAGRFVSYPLKLTPSNTPQFFDIPSDLSLAPLLKNPMVWMIGVGVFTSIVMPRVTAAYEAEVKEQKREKEREVAAGAAQSPGSRKRRN